MCSNWGFVLKLDTDSFVPRIAPCSAGRHLPVLPVLPWLVPREGGNIHMGSKCRLSRSDGGIAVATHNFV